MTDDPGAFTPEQREALTDWIAPNNDRAWAVLEKIKADANERGYLDGYERGYLAGRAARAVLAPFVALADEWESKARRTSRRHSGNYVANWLAATRELRAVLADTTTEEPA